jgi:redox-sensitive bicupin YhaK (pirin superfamily)
MFKHISCSQEAAMIDVRPAASRGHGQHGWLDTWHTFPFAEYQDPAHMQFRALRVINEDRVQPGQGFGAHGHRDMEILTWVLEGELAHEDSMGHRQGLRPGSSQAMSAGTGVRHSEFNGSDSELVHFLQIWILPDRAGRKPGYQEAAFPDTALRNRLGLIAGRDGAEGSVVLHQDVEVRVARLDPGASVRHAFAPGRHGYVQVAKGAVTLNGHPLAAGDGAALSGEAEAMLVAAEASEVLLFDLA